MGDADCALHDNRRYEPTPLGSSINRLDPWKDVGMGKILLLVALATATGVAPTGSAAVGPRETTKRFVAAVNRADFRTACDMYSRRYLKATKAQCRDLYRQGLA